MGLRRRGCDLTPKRMGAAYALVHSLQGDIQMDIKQAMAEHGNGKAGDALAALLGIDAILRRNGWIINLDLVPPSAIEFPKMLYNGSAEALATDAEAETRLRQQGYKMLGEETVALQPQAQQSRQLVSPPTPSPQPVAVDIASVAMPADEQAAVQAEGQAPVVAPASNSEVQSDGQI